MTEHMRTRLCLMLALGSPVVAVLLTASLIVVSANPGMSKWHDAIAGLVFFNFALGSLGSAAGVMLAPGVSVIARVALAIAYALVAFFGHWILTAIIAVSILGV